MKPIKCSVLILIISLGWAACTQVQPNTVEPDASLTPTGTMVPPDPTSTLTPSPNPTSTPSQTSLTPNPPDCQSKTGRVEDEQLETGWLPTPLEYRVYTPPCYLDHQGKRYPVLFLIHGYGFNQDQWDRLAADEIADRLITAGEISPFIIVMPHDSNHNSLPPENQFGQALFDLVERIDASYRTIPLRQYRAIGGLSRGGNWAIHLGLTHWASFGAIGGHSAPLFVTDGPSKVEEWLGQIPPDQHPRVYLDIGKSDKWIDHIIRFEERLDDYNVPHELYIFSGSHNEAYWASHTEQYIRWYAKGW